ncbi:deoxyribose-phosphate aldolase [Bacillus xiapuensis]|uniref:deoxyribose-phosphate aldolase n=1 Tax=Bacillus xiapuensis TaxID=2014075 RepID=UPI000C24813B|nr:deoxyribose-phosphate aldolase [Bacillus xiapuensis]
MITKQFGDMAKTIDHTLLKADATKEEIKKLCEEAKAYGFASVCVNPSWVAFASEQLAGTEVKVCTVIGFPLGATTTEVKAFETKDVIQKGAQEVDMVLNIGALKDGDEETVLKDIQAVTAAAKGKALSKVIIETSLLTDEEKQKACQLAVAAGADYVKTSTGFSTGGATVEDVALMRRTVGPHVGVKASGGVRSKEDAENMIKAGATRIGASSGVKIIQGLKSDSSY